jgi:hypothetical protein
MPAEVFEQLMFNAGYTVVGSAPAKGNRIKVWWNHSIAKSGVVRTINR